MPQVVKTLSSAKVSLYYVNAGGEPITSPVVWSGASAEGLTLTYKYDTVETKPTGAKYPSMKVINERHTISISKVWVTNHNDATPSDPVDFTPERTRRYVMAVSWVDQSRYGLSEDRWTTRVYYGATNDAHDLTSQGMFEFKNDQAFKAQFMREKHGTGAVPAA